MIPSVIPRNMVKTNLYKHMYSNFIGPESKFVASGSDDGRIFIWETERGTLVNILGIYLLS